MISNLKDLEKLLKLARKQGVTELDLGSVKFKLGDLPVDTRPAYEQEAIPSDNQFANFPDGELTQEQLAYYSAGGNPEEDPFRTDN